MQVIKKHMRQYAFCGLTVDGMRQFRVNLGIN
jgi:hypothetical protein